MSHLSFEGQSELDYCIECSVKHGQTAKVLMREALQRARAENPASEGVKEKIQGVVEELVGFEDDTNTIQNENVQKLNTAARELRKHVYSSKAEIGGADIKTLNDIKDRIDALTGLAYQVREEEEICVSCVDWLCYGNEACKNFLEKAAESGDKQKFHEAVEEAKTREWEILPIEIDTRDLSEYGVSVAEKRRKLIEDISKDVG